jgi:hypothetical protein
MIICILNHDELYLEKLRGVHDAPLIKRITPPVSGRPKRQRFGRPLTGGVRGGAGINPDAFPHLPTIGNLALGSRHRASCDLRQGGFRLGQPKGHLHGTVEVDRGAQLRLRLLPLAGLGVEGAESQVAMRLQRAHAQFLGQGQGLAVVGGGLLGT